MNRRMIFPILLGLLGAAILCALGIWQVQRLDWKQSILKEIETRLNTDEVSIPENPDYDRDNYRSVTVSGVLEGPELHVLVTKKPDGPGFRVIRALETADRRILVDLGYIREAQKADVRAGGAITLTGNLIWPDETDGFTPDPNFERNIWFARDVDRMSESLGTFPLMVAMRGSDPVQDTIPMPVTVNIPNDHLQYAITWFSLMIIWLGMTAYLLWRIKRAEA